VVLVHMAHNLVQQHALLARVIKAENIMMIYLSSTRLLCKIYEGWNFNSGNYLFTNDTK